MTVRRMAGALVPGFLRRRLLPPLGRLGSASSPALSLVLVTGESEDDSAAVRTLSRLLGQRHEPLEIIVAGVQVSAPAVRKLADADTRVRLLSPAATLAEACRSAAGDAVALIEPGAQVPESYYTTLLPELLASSADFVAGLHPRPRTTAGRQAVRLGSAARMRLSLAALPSAFSDTALWPRLSTRSFLHTVLEALPADPESHRIAARMLLEADRFGFVPVSVPEPARHQEDEQPADLLHSLRAAWRRMEPELAAAPAEAASHWFGESFGGAWAVLAREVPRGDSRYWKALGEAAAALAATPSALDRFSVHDRVLAALAAADRLEDFRTVLAEIQDGGHGYRVHADDGELRACPSYLHLLGYRVPREILRLSGADFPVRSRLRTFEWETAGLRLGGFAYVPGIGGGHAPRVQVFLTDPETGKRTDVATQAAPGSAINETTGDRWNDYSGAGFTALVSWETLKTAAGSNATWFVETEVVFHSGRVSGRLAKRDGGFVPSRLPLGEASGGRRIVAQFDQVQGLRLHTVSYRYLAAHPRTDGNSLFLGFVGEAPSRVVLEAAGQQLIELQQVPGNPGAFSLPPTGAAEPAGGNAVYHVKAEGPAGGLLPVGAAEGSASLPDISAEIRPGMTGFGYLTLSIADRRLEVTGWSLASGTVALQLAGPGARDLSAASLRFEGPAGYWPAEHVEAVAGGAVLARFPLCHDPWGTGPVLRTAGRYVLKAAGPTDADVHAVAVAPAMAGAAAQASHPRLRIRSGALSAGESFHLHIDSPLTDVEKGAYNQQRLIDAYQKTTEPLTEAVFFETFGGTSTADSGGAICDALAALKPALRRYWSVADPSVPVPAGAVAVHRYSAEWFRVLGTAKYLVNNNTFPVFFRKKPGQVYLQTWHGSPLKRIGLDMPEQLLTPSYLRTLHREPAEWDALLAQSAGAAKLLAGAFCYRGEVQVLGYPRNDSLVHGSTDERRKRARGHLQIPEEQTVVLYAPTWRDTVRTRGDRHAAVSYLDAGLARTVLGPNYTILFRGHHSVAGQRSASGIDGLLDVTEHPQISELCLAADLLVTDYSSVMFDFALTGKPMFFLVPDLAQYRDEVRGFYFDLTKQAPGPIAESSRELFEQMRTYDPDRWEQKYRSFRQGYAPLDDGTAAIRVCRAVWGDD